jgi:hypothetical protein
MNVVEQLLALDKGKLVLPSEDVLIKRLGITFTCMPISIDLYNEIQQGTVENRNKQGKLKDGTFSEAQFKMILAGIPVLKDKTLLKHFGVPTPYELIKTLFNVGEVNLLTEIISRISGIEDIENSDKEIKNS